MTIKDIAKLSGYGIGTVSRVINNQPGVSDKAKKKIQKVIEESNYEPNESARSLKRRGSDAIGIIIKGNQNLFFAEVLEKIQNNLLRYNEDVIVQYIGEDDDEVEAALSLLKNRFPKGIMFLGADLSMYDERVKDIHIPCVIVTTDGKSLKYDNISSVSIDDEKATYEMMKRLIERGHRKIGVVGGKLSDNRISSSRFRGCKKCMNEYGLDLELDSNYIPCEYNIEAGYEATKHLLDNSSGLTAIFAMSDTIALGVMRGIADRGFRVPEDISVAGFDGISLTSFSIPRLSTVRQSIELLANRSVSLLLERTHYDIGSVHEKVAFEIIERESIMDLK
ncbi:MAG: LacI family DNA-binding transcriptional regulator [Butyribacter sp.]|nr:LacI family DNA-binding transcriptional regulator [bacterium]MDY3853872.1 LacI family DNA-binding transcriptional regulator [Butyribacter sp.]